MASASSSSARHLFNDSKRQLAERVSINVNNIGSVARQIVRGSKSNEILAQTVKNFAQHETAMDNSSQNLHKIGLILQHLHNQNDAVKENCEKLADVKEKVQSMER